MTTIAEESALVDRIQSGDIDARNELVMLNIGLVYKLANQFAKYTSMPKDDLISVGTVGLIEAANRFNPGKAKFSTYANHWIRKEMIQGYREAKSITYIPPYVFCLMSKQKKGEKLTEREAKKIRQAETALREQKHFVSKPIDTKPKFDFDQVEFLNSSLAKMDDRSQTIIKHRFGMIDGEERTHKEIAEMFGVSKQRICQLYERAMGVLQMGAP
jgi:RNA polymerase sporulation-specific sigma factor